MKPPHEAQAVWLNGFQSNIKFINLNTKLRARLSNTALRNR